MQDGKRCSGSIPYGYKRIPGDKQTLYVDEEAAAVVRRIFDMAASGASLAQIGQTLSDEKVLIPSAYEEQYHPESARPHGRGAGPRRGHFHCQQIRPPLPHRHTGRAGPECRAAL